MLKKDVAARPTDLVHDVVEEVPRAQRASVHQRLGAAQTVAVLDAARLHAQCLYGGQPGQQAEHLINAWVQVVVV